MFPFFEVIEDISRSELGNLLHLPNTDIDLLLPGVSQPPVQPLQDGRGLVLPGANDEGEAELVPVLGVVAPLPPHLVRGQEVEAGLALLPGGLRGQEVLRGQAARQVGVAAQNANLG